MSEPMSGPDLLPAADPHLALTPWQWAAFPVPAQVFPHAINVLRAGKKRNREGNWEDDWMKPVSTPARGWMQTTMVATVRTGREALISEWLLVCPADTPIDGYCKVEYEGKTFKLIGPPERASTPHGWHHIEARLQYVEG